MNKTIATLGGIILVCICSVTACMGCSERNGTSENAKGSSQTHGTTQKASRDSSQLHIEAYAFQETPGPSAATPYPDYSVLLRLTNRGETPFVYDKMEVAWVPEKGKGLTGVSTPGEAGGLFRIEPGETKEYWESSSERAHLLLRDAGDRPLLLQVTLLRDGKCTFGPVRTSLPRLGSLGNIHKAGRSGGSPLTFVPSTTPDTTRSHSSQPEVPHLRPRGAGIIGTAAVVIEEGETMTSASFRKQAIIGEVGAPMTDSRVVVVIASISRDPASMAGGYQVIFAIVNRGSSNQTLDTVEGVIYSEAPRPIIRTITCYFDKERNVRQLPIELAPGEFEEFEIPTMGREGIPRSVGVALTYRDKTQSRFWIEVTSGQITDSPRTE